MRKGWDTSKNDFQRVVPENGPSEHFVEESRTRRRCAVDWESAGRQLPSVTSIIVSDSSHGVRSHQIQPCDTPLAPESAEAVHYASCARTRFPFPGTKSVYVLSSFSGPNNKSKLNSSPREKYL
ncbi:hypothetical protein HJG60_008318 [Phyllostomus discolor]|uniref:Uncharacterized protein n=1 Tax=Phyllostomus discolor TaxID=89673 RepID=A0A833Z6W9_9CHIR|nr:hypothetical protein HJG60_008318 [Phyllostomus discolor]